MRNWVGLAGGVERDGEGQVSVGWGQEGSSRHLHPGGSIPGPWLSDLAPWECALPPGRGFPHICLTPWCPLVMTWECGAALGQVFLSREFGPVWHVVHPGVFSVGCLGKEIREECVCRGDGWEQLEIGRNVGGMLVRLSASLEGGQGTDRVDGGPTAGLSCAWLLRGWARG